MTNRDKLNNMSNEEFAKLINSPLADCKCCAAYYSGSQSYCDDCVGGIIEWLESEADNG